MSVSFNLDVDTFLELTRFDRNALQKKPNSFRDPQPMRSGVWFPKDSSVSMPH